MEGLSGKTVYHLHPIFKQCIFIYLFFPPLFTETWSFLYPIPKDGKRNRKKKKEGSFLFKYKHFKWLGGSGCCWEPYPPLCSSCCCFPSSCVLCNLPCTHAVWHHQLFQLAEQGESPTHKMYTIMFLPLWRGAHSLIMLSGNVFLACFQQLTKKFISKPSMQQYLQQNKIEKVRIGDKPACDERKRLHLLGRGLTSWTVIQL